MKSFTEDYLKNLSVNNELVRMIRRLGEYKGKQELFKRQSPDVLENLRRVALVQSTESSNRLEQITAEPKRFKALMEEKTKPKNRSEAEIAGYRDILNTIHTSALNIPFRCRVVQQFHRDILKFTGLPGGKWKSAPNKITDTLPDGSRRVRFIPVDPFLVEDCMTRLHQTFQEELSMLVLDPLILIPLYILDFLCIHPFTDGNGRISRLVTILLLYQQGYEVGRYIGLERVIENTKESYYDALETSSNGWHKGKHEAIPWITYFLSTVLAAYEEFERRADMMVTGRGSKTEMVVNAIESFVGEFSISDIEKACPLVGRDMIRHVLNRLRDDGKIVNLSKGRYSRWQKI